MMAYQQLDYLTRCKIYGLWKGGLNQTEIATEIGVHKSTISREFKRNLTYVHTAFGSWQYKSDYAQGSAERRRKEKPKHIKFTKEAEQFVCEKLKEEWSPEQISGEALLLQYERQDNIRGNDPFKAAIDWIKTTLSLKNSAFLEQTIF
jgi:IS30 family transposase